MGLRVAVFYSVLYATVCWVSLSSFRMQEISPEFFLLLFFVSLALGFVLIVAQVNNDTGDSGEQVVMLSGEIIPAVTPSPERQQEEEELQTWVEKGKVIFFFLSIFLLVSWIRLSFHGFPKEWWDKGYGLLIFMYSFGKAGQELSNGNGLRAYLSFVYIEYPYLLSLPYAWFMYWALRGQQMFSAYLDYE